MEMSCPRLGRIRFIAQNFSGDGGFTRCRRAADRETVRAQQTRVVVREFLGRKPLRSQLCLFAHERVVHQEQCLRRDRAGVARANDHARIGEIECFEDFGKRGYEMQAHTHSGAAR